MIEHLARSRQFGGPGDRSAMHLADFPQLKSATPEQKLERIDELWASIPPEAVPTLESYVAELNRRLDALDRDPAKALSPEEARARIRKRTGL